YPDLDALLPRLAAVATLDAAGLEAERIAVLGRKQGLLTHLLKRLPELPVEERKSFDAAVNRLKEEFEAALEARSQALAGDRPAPTEGLDLTMPGRRRWVGAEHPVTRAIDEICDIFRGLVFSIAVGPEVEDE